MVDRQPITSETIESICKEFGFLHGFEKGKHFATVGGNVVEVKFTNKGGLPTGRHAFMTAARKASGDFLAAYPPSERPSREPGKEGEANPVAKPSLGNRFFAGYSIPELEKAMEVIDRMIDRKKEAKEQRVKIEETERSLKSLQEIAGNLEANALGRYQKLEDKIAELKRKLKELRGDDN